ncbi:MAG: peptidoglycan DD-metalloendopeptidase family protein [Actinomycetota bacterium]|nr:peptidoglycan DD-metalloendopeptidase family protein [Actinomycetota bacterium]
MQPMATVTAFAATLLVIAGAPATGAALPPSLFLTPPVDSVITRYFEPPESDYGRGHRGIDYGVVPGVKVRASAAGIVSFAGQVAGANAVTLDHGGGVETTYTRLGIISVLQGMRIDQGHFVGTSSAAHPGEWAGLHFGVKVHDRYVDPLTYLGPVDVSEAIRLAPTVEDLEGEVDTLTVVSSGRAGTHHRACAPTPRTRGLPRPPNDNIAVSIAGLNSSTKSGTPDLFRSGAGAVALGYPPERIYRYSYRGTAGRDLHRPYSGLDTQGDLRSAARRLMDLLRAIGRHHPGARVDLIAHSQGGIVARAALEMMATAFDPALPSIAHLVTLATPHEGAPLAALLEDLRTRTLTGRLALSGLSRALRGGGPLPDPGAIAVKQLVPGSDLLNDLAAEDITYGTRVLALGIANDLIVPADHSDYPGKVSRIVGPEGAFGHDALIGSVRALAKAHAFLRDAAPPCESSADRLGPLAGGFISFSERRAVDLYSEVEGALGGRLWRGLKRADRALGSPAKRVGRAVGAGGRWARDLLEDLSRLPGRFGRLVTTGSAGTE